MFEVAHAPCYTRESSPKNGYLNHPPAASTMNGNSVVILPATEPTIVSGQLLIGDAFHNSARYMRCSQTRYKIPGV